MIDDNRIHFSDTEEFVPCIKSYLKDSEEEVPYSVAYFIKMEEHLQKDYVP